MASLLTIQSQSKEDAAQTMPTYAKRFNLQLSSLFTLGCCSVTQLSLRTDVPFTTSVFEDVVSSDERRRHIWLSIPYLTKMTVFGDIAC
jgi:hypothetical protein